MGWIKLSSIFFIIVFVIFLTLGGREFFENFDVDVTKKTTSDNPSVSETKENNVTGKQEKNHEDEIQPKKQKDDEWSDFN
jgi:uncharacterized membrane protein YkgB